MRCLRGDQDVRSRPRVELISQAELRELIEEQIEETPTLPDEQSVLDGFTLIGMIEPADTSEDAEVELQLSGLLGFYSSEAKLIVILEDPDLGGMELGPEQPALTLGHEYVHALQDLEFDLDEYLVEHSSTTDTSLAARSVIEGEAELFGGFQQAAFAGVSPNEQDWPEWFEQYTNLADEVGAELESPLLLAPSVFPYTYGPHTSALAWRRGGKPEVIAERAEELSTQGYLARRHDAPVHTSPNVESLVLARVPGTRSLGSDGLGAWLVHSFLVQHLGHLATPDAALEWRGDAMTLFTDEETGRTGVVWNLSFASETTAQDIARQVNNEANPAGGQWAAFEQGAVTTIVATDGDDELLARLLSAAGAPEEDDPEDTIPNEAEPSDTEEPQAPLDLPELARRTNVVRRMVNKYLRSCVH